MPKKNVLFACNMNSVRSPMAARLVQLLSNDQVKADSAGVYEGGLDPFVEIVMDELGVPMSAHEPKLLSTVDLKDFDVLIALTPEAALEINRIDAQREVERWEVENPSEERGGREAVETAYRKVRDQLALRLRERFPEIH